jgi:hypothetical protein
MSWQGIITVDGAGKFTGNIVFPSIPLELPEGMSQHN